MTGSFIAAQQVGKDSGRTTGVFSRTGIWAGSCAHKGDAREVVNFNGTHSHDLNMSDSGGSEAYPKHIIMPYYLRTLNI